jgi:hypothetical protein
VGIPIDAAGSEINGIINLGISWHGTSACRPRVEVVWLQFEMEAAAADKGDRLAESRGDGG